MIRALTGITAIALLNSVVYAQPTESRPTFEAADVHVAPQTVIRFMRGGTLHGTRYEIRNASMLDLISTAYGVDPDKVLGGPAWLEMDRFELFATAPARTSTETLNLMLRSLLADRFKLAVKEEPKPMPAYALRVGKQLLIKESDGSGEPGCKQTLDTGSTGPRGDGPVMISSLTIVLTCKNTSIASFTDQLPIPRKAGEPNRPVVDQTGLKGTWNFDFKYNLGGINADAAPISDALEKQLGLKLVPETLPMPVIEVQSVNQKPTPNSPEDMKSFPPLPTEFDVAEIKPFKPSTDNQTGGGIMFAVRGGRGGVGGPGQQLQNGRVNLQGRTIKDLIMQAWDLNSDDQLIGAPKWLDTDRFDVIGKVPSGPIADAFTDLDSIKPLLRTLLMDRFKLAVHTEERPLPGYVLTAPKPKLKKADPANRSRCFAGPGADGKDPRNGNAAMGRLMTCQNVTMAQFADLLANFAGGYFRTSAIVDKTGLEGAWDLTIYFLAAGGDGGRGGGMRVAVIGGAGVVGNDTGSASDPSGGMTLFDAVNKLLGLKLEMQPRPVPVLVIDHVEQKPTDN